MNPNDEVTQKLKEWRLQVPCCADFRSGVWKRIEATKSSEILGRARVGLIGATCLVGMLASAWSGHSYARAQMQAERESLATSYLSNLDARSHAGLHR